jgi:hypothetical protein
VDSSLGHSAFLMIRPVLVMVLPHSLLEGSERFSPYTILRFAGFTLGLKGC